MPGLGRTGLGSPVLLRVRCRATLEHAGDAVYAHVVEPVGGHVPQQEGEAVSGGATPVASPVLGRNPCEFISWHGASLKAALLAAVGTEIVRGDDAVGANPEPLPATPFEGFKKLRGGFLASLAFELLRRAAAAGLRLRVFWDFLLHGAAPPFCGKDKEVRGSECEPSVLAR